MKVALNVGFGCLFLFAVPCFCNQNVPATITFHAAQSGAGSPGAKAGCNPISPSRCGTIPWRPTIQAKPRRMLDGSSYPSVDAAITAAFAQYPTPVVALPCGTFTLDPIALPVNSMAIVQGSGESCTIIDLTGTGNAYAFEMSSGSTLTLSALTLNLQGNAAAGVTSSLQAAAYTLSLNNAQIENYTAMGIGINDPGYVYIINHSWIGTQSALCTSWQCYAVNIGTTYYSPRLIDVEDSTFDQSKEGANNFVAFFVDPNPSFWTTPSPIQAIIIANNTFLAPLRDAGESDILVLGSSDAGSSATQFVTGVVLGNQMLAAGAYDSNFSNGITIGSQLAGFESLMFTNNYVKNADAGVLVENCPSTSRVAINNLIVNDSGLSNAAYGSYGLLVSTATAAPEGTNPCYNVAVNGGRFSWRAGVWSTGIRIDGWSSAHVQGATLTNWAGAGIDDDGGNTVIEDNLITFSPTATLAGPYPNGIVNDCGGFPCSTSDTSNYTFKRNTIVGVWKGITFIGNMPLSNVIEDSNVMINVANPYPQPYPGVSVTTQ